MFITKRLDLTTAQSSITITSGASTDVILFFNSDTTYRYSHKTGEVVAGDEYVQINSPIAVPFFLTQTEAIEGLTLYFATVSGSHSITIQALSNSDNLAIS